MESYQYVIIVHCLRSQNTQWEVLYGMHIQYIYIEIYMIIYWPFILHCVTFTALQYLAHMVFIALVKSIQ